MSTKSSVANAGQPTRAVPAVAGGRGTDGRIVALQTSYEDYAWRTPMKFGGMVLDRVTLLNVECEIVLRGGRRARGFGSMPLSNAWAFRSAAMSYDQTLAAMKALAEQCRQTGAGHGEFGDPISLGVELEHRCWAAACTLSRELNLADPIPKLAALVTASPFDAALHDAFGKAHGLNCYRTYSREFLQRDLGAYLGPAFDDEWPEDYLRPAPHPRIALYHTVGALDPLVESDIRTPVADDLPETLEGWIRRSGVTHLKIKLNGDDLAWDFARVAAVHAVAEESARRLDRTGWRYSIDFNECCQSVGHLVELLRLLGERLPSCFERLQFVEQPMPRDLGTSRHTGMREAARLKPIVIDESLTDLASLQQSRDLGYSGIVLKACKGQSQSLLMAAMARKQGLFVCVQDLGCPGASLIHSAGLAAHLPGIDALESNSRQYCPAANRGWEDRFPGIFKVRDGMMETHELTGPGLGAVPAQVAGNGMTHD